MVPKSLDPTWMGHSVYLRDCADGVLAEVVGLDRAGVPTVFDPGFFQQSAQDDDRVSQAGPGLLCWCRPIQDDLQDAKNAGMPGIGALDHPSLGVIDLHEGAFWRDLPVTV